MADNWKKLWDKQADLAKACKVQELKDYCKSVQLPMAGDVSTLANRVQTHLDVKFLDLSVVQEGEKKTPYQLKLPELRKIVAQLGMDPSGDKDELYSNLVDYLKKKQATSAGSSGSGTANAAGASSSNNEAAKGLLTAEQILKMADDYPAILSTSGINITVDSSLTTMRKAYLKLSVLIHPDKCKFPEATKAFQCLVTAYERMSQPELFMDEDEDEEEEDPKKKKGKKVMRSNDGCHRTQIFCPRCRGEWGLPDSGVEQFDYNFMMKGLRTFNCAGCLCEFGCMTATHKCPFCYRTFDYHPNDYNRKITCGNAKCNKAFGFFIFPISDRVEKEYRAEIRRKQEKQLKEREQLEQRKKRANARFGGNAPDSSDSKNQLFILNLLDACPKCGEENIDTNEREQHLSDCKDKGKIAEYAKRLREEAQSAEKKRKLEEAQAEVQNVSSWEFLGGKITDLWLLTETQLIALCEKYGLDSTGSGDELITRIAKWKNAADSRRMITSGEAGDAEEGAGGGAPPSKKSKKLKITVEDLPSNMESMTVGQLKAVCASFGIITRQETKAGIISDIEKRVHGEEAMLQITDGKKKK